MNPLLMLLLGGMGGLGGNQLGGGGGLFGNTLFGGQGGAESLMQRLFGGSTQPGGAAPAWGPPTAQNPTPGQGANFPTGQAPGGAAPPWGLPTTANPNPGQGTFDPASVTPTPAGGNQQTRWAGGSPLGARTVGPAPGMPSSPNPNQFEGLPPIFSIFPGLLNSVLGGNSQFYLPQPGVPGSPSGPVTGGMTTFPTTLPTKTTPTPTQPTQPPVEQQPGGVGPRGPIHFPLRPIMNRY